MSNIIFIRCKLFTCKMQEGENLLNHVNKVQALMDQLVYLQIPMKDENITMTLFVILPVSYEYLITIIKMISIKELTMDYVTTRFMYKMSKCKKN